MEKAKSKAFEVGYPYRDDPNGVPYALKSDDELLMDPDFWKCLGNSENWKPVYYKCGSNCGNMILEGDYKYHWKRLIEYIDENKSVDSFFNELIK